MRARWATWVLVAALGGLASADAAPGEVRSVQARQGVVLREAPKALSKKVADLPYGTRVRVSEVSQPYAKVRLDDGTEGWLRVTDIVAPSALTGGGAAGPVANTTGIGSGVVESADLSAAGRQFDEGLEAQYRASEAQLDAAYRALDALQAKGPKPDSAEVEAFVIAGKLGRKP